MEDNFDKFFGKVWIFIALTFLGYAAVVVFIGWVIVKILQHFAII